MMHRSLMGPHFWGPILLIAAILPGCSTNGDAPLSNRGELRAISQTSGSPLARCTSDAATSLPGDGNIGAEVEPSLAINPDDPSRIAVAWQQDRWFDGASRGIVVASTRDGGSTWHTSTETRLSACTGGAADEGEGYPRVTDPWLSFGTDGTLHLVGLAVNLDPGASVGANPESILATTSKDGGLTWNEPITLIRDDDRLVYNDKPSLTADPNDPALVYSVWHRLTDVGDFSIDGETMLARSTDGGSTWETARSILGPIKKGQSFGNEIVVLPRNEMFDGELVNVFSLVSAEKGRKERVQLASITSDDEGVTWSEPVIIAELDAKPLEDPITGNHLKTGHLLPRTAVDPVSGALYVAWSTSRYGVGIQSDVAFSMSIDGGRTWSRPQRVNQTPAVGNPGVRQAFLPEIAAGGDGELTVSYFDFRNNTGLSAEDDLGTDLFLARCTEPSPSAPGGCGHEWQEIRVTPSSFNLRAAPSAGGAPFLGDYLGLASAGSDVVIAFPQANDEGDPSSIYLDTFPTTSEHRSGPP